MKRTIFIAALMSCVACTVRAEDVNVTGGSVNYTDKAVTSSSKDGKVLGGAMSSDGAVSISGAQSINFSNNTARNAYTSAHTTADVDLAAGGAIYGASVNISGTSGDITFTENTIRAKTTNDARTRVRGGALKGGTVSITNNTGSNISFTGNKAYDEYKAWDETAQGQIDKPRFSYGGAIYADTAMSISGNGNLTFSGNEAGRGGAISAGYGATTTLSGNGILSFSGNIAEYGGAAYNGAYIYKNNTNAAGYANLSITGNAEVSFMGNSARQNGGAIYNQSNSTLSISNNLGNVLFSGNKATLYGGAIRGQSNSTIELNGNTGSVSFTGNSVTLATTTNVYGGAISADANSAVNLHNNGCVTISNNTAQTNSSAYGGGVAVYNSTLSIMGNTQGVTIEGNSVVATHSSSWGSGVSAEGGAVYGKALYLQGNSGTVSVKNNVAQAVNNGTAKGGAFYVTDTLAITGNDNVEFRGNVQQSSNQTILRSVYVDSKSKTGALKLSANVGGSITFYDSLYAAPNSSSYTLSADFNAESGNTGAIVFSGKHAEADLLAKNAQATSEEIALSRTSTIQSNINLHQGSLAVESQAVLQSKGLQVAGPATLRLQNGTIEMLENTALTLSDKSTLQVGGSNVITADTLSFADGCTFNLSLSLDNATNALLTLNTASLTYGDSVVNFLGLDKLQDGDYLLLNLKGSDSLSQHEWNTESIAISGLGLGDSFEWRDNGTSLYLIHTTIPEPTTATLSMLALAALAMRRRRK